MGGSNNDHMFSIHYERVPVNFIHEKQAEAFHEKMSRLFTENRFLFELERKKLIAQAIEAAEGDGQKTVLKQIQGNLERILNNAGSEHNRFVLMQMLFWDGVNQSFRPLINRLTRCDKRMKEQENGYRENPGTRGKNGRPAAGTAVRHRF